MHTIQHCQPAGAKAGHWQYASVHGEDLLSIPTPDFALLHRHAMPLNEHSRPRAVKIILIQVLVYRIRASVTRVGKIVEVTVRIYSLRTFIKYEYFWIASLPLKFKLTNRYHNLQPKTLGTSS